MITLFFNLVIPPYSSYELNNCTKNMLDIISRKLRKAARNAADLANKKKSNSCDKRDILSYSRREKSLEELSKKFLSLFLDKSESLLSLDKITNQLGVERRRIYDIINILESLKLVSRKGKNNYKWNGFNRIYDTISFVRSGIYILSNKLLLLSLFCVRMV